MHVTLIYDDIAMSWLMLFSSFFFGMETKKIIIDLQNIIQTMWKINFKKNIVTTYFNSNPSNYVLKWKQGSTSKGQPQNNWIAQQINGIHYFKFKSDKQTQKAKTCSFLDKIFLIIIWLLSTSSIYCLFICFAFQIAFCWSYLSYFVLHNFDHSCFHSKR